MKKFITPFTDEDIAELKIGDMIYISGEIYCGRDAVLPKICELISLDKLKEYHNVNLKGGVIFHTAVSPAGVGPTSSNKLEIEESFPLLSREGIKLHLGKGAISKETVRILDEYNSIYAVIPPVTALLEENTYSRKLIAFPELGMEALYKLCVKEYPVIIAAAHNKSIY